MIGGNGSGKSTLVRLLNGLVQASSGRVLVDGVDVAARGSEVRRRVGFCFTDPAAQLVMPTCVEDVELSLRRTIPDRAARRTAALDVLARFGLSDRADVSVHALSGGQRQRVGLARALALQPAVLVADEPVSALDVSVQAQVLNLLAELRERLGLSIIFITHDLRVAAQICDLVAVMKDGEIVEHGAAGDVFANPQHPYTRALLASVPGGEFARSHETADA